jgi:hypothetical protein
MQTFTLLCTYDPVFQLIDTVAIAAKTGAIPAAFSRTLLACKEYTSYTCNPYAIFEIYCIGNSALSHSQKDREFISP